MPLAQWAAPVHDRHVPVDMDRFGADGARRALPPLERGAARYRHLFSPQHNMESDMADVPAPAATAHPNTSARPAGDPHERGTGRQAPGKEVRRSAYADGWARPYPPVTDRITPYEGNQLSRQRDCSPRPRRSCSGALRATRTSTV